MGSARDDLSTALQNPDPTARQLALIAREESVEPDLLEPLIVAVGDADTAVRRLAVGMLEQLGDARAVPVVVAALADEDPGVQEAAQSAIREFRGPEAAAHLLAAADHASPAVRTWVIVGLRELKDPRATPILLQALEDDSAEVRRAAVVTLAYLRSADGLLALVRRLGDEDAGVRRLVVAALGRAWSPERGAEVAARLKDDDWQVRAEAAAALGNGRAVEATGALVAATRDSHWQVVKAAAAALGALRGAEAAPALLRLLESEVPDVRRAGAQALGDLRAPAAGPRLRGLLSDADIEVRKAATRALEILSTSVLCLIMLMLSLGGCKTSSSSSAGEPDVTIRVAIGTQDTTINCATGGLVIREEHLLEKYLPHDGKYARVHWDVVWKDFPTGMTLTSEMIAGKLDFGSMGDFPSVLNAVAFKKQGQKSLYIATLSGSATGAGNGLLVPSDSPAQTLADLRGKTISVPFGSAAHGMLLRAIRDQGWDPERDVTIVAQTPEVGGSSLKAGKVDAHADFVPFAELFPFRGFARKILDGSTAIAAGEFVTILGPSGCGKSTLLGAMGGFVRPASGSVTVDGAVVHRPSPTLGMVFQQQSLFPWRTVIDNVAFGLKMRGVARKERRREATAMIDLVGLTGFKDAYPAQLSGGMQHRAEIARVLVNRPTALLMDEPFGALDAQTRASMQELLLGIWTRLKTTIVFVTHDIDEAILLGDRVLMMTDRPGSVGWQRTVDIARPRLLDVMASQAFLDVKRECASRLRMTSTWTREAEPTSFEGAVAEASAGT